MRTAKKQKSDTKQNNDLIERTAGLWKGMKETGLEYERRLRRDWRKREIK